MIRVIEEPMTGSKLTIIYGDYEELSRWEKRRGIQSVFMEGYAGFANTYTNKGMFEFYVFFQKHEVAGVTYATCAHECLHILFYALDTIKGNSGRVLIRPRDAECEIYYYTNLFNAVGNAVARMEKAYLKQGKGVKK